VIAVTHAPWAHAETRWQLDARAGGAWNVPLPTVVRQEAHPDVRLTARWRTRAFEYPLYYGWRVTRWRDTAGWALDLVHHKLHLEDPPPEIQRLSISHGYNLVTLQRLAERRGWRYGGGLGAVVSHPESEVRGRAFDEHGGLFGAGYYVSGPTVGALLGHSRAIHGRLDAIGELRLTVSYASAPIAGGAVRVPNLAVHGTVGLGWFVRR